MEERCEKCSKYLKDHNIELWELIYKIIERKPKISSKVLLFGDTEPERRNSDEK